ncbi:MAG: RNA polymerase sigma factor, partial [Solirubrobacteraceae bacterium]
MHDTDAAADLWAEVWAIAFENWERCRARDHRQAEAWVLGIARHQLASYYRCGAIERRALERLKWSVPVVDDALEAEIERVAHLDALQSLFAEALSKLPVKRRRAVRLRVILGLDYREVADRMGCSEQAARAHVSRGLRK